jgi:hypothetical protein
MAWLQVSSKEIHSGGPQGATLGILEYLAQSNNSADVPTHNQYVPAQNLESQKWLDEINQWTQNLKMLINTKKTKTMTFNFTEKYQFSTRLLLNNEIVENLSKTKLLGTIITDDLRWDENTLNIVRKAKGKLPVLGPHRRILKISMYCL